MAVEWTITPLTEYTAVGNGIKLTIPSENPPSKYIISYSDDNGCVGSTTVTVRTDCGGGGGGGGDDPHPDPDPVTGVPTMDNMGKVCNERKSTPQGWDWAATECPDHWWSGPFDDDDIQGIDDIGINSAGDNFTDSIRYPDIGEGTHGNKVTSYTSNAFTATVDSDYASWISFKVIIEEHELYDGTSPGWIKYYVDTNNSSDQRIGTVSIRTTGGTSCCDWVAGSGYRGQAWMTEGKVYFYQQGNGESPAACECSTFSSTTTGNEVPSAITSEEIAVALYSAATHCSEQIKVSGKKSGENFLTNFRFGDDGKIYATVGANNPTNESRTSEYWVKQGNCQDYFTVTQKKGDGSTPVSDCPVPSASSGLDAMLAECNFEQVLGCYITTTGTPCTYTYLKAAYNAVSSEPNTTKSWMIANVLSELTPYNDMSSDYFEVAARTYGGIRKDLNTYESLYDERIEGALEYVKFKYNNYSSTQEMAAKARTELQNQNVTKAVLRPRLHPEKSDPVWFARSEGVHMLPIIPSSAPSNAIGSDDVTDTQSLIGTYKVANDCQQAMKDKSGCGAYLASIMSINDDGRYAEFIDMSTDVATAGNNQVKWDSAPHKRWRPGAQQKLTNVFTIPTGGDTNVYLCDCSIETASLAMCGEACDCTDDVASFTNIDDTIRQNGNASFPSGHSANAYMAFLCCVEVLGNSGDKSRIIQYCRNRNLVRAHWRSDVTAGKLCASMQIGYLNGFEEYHKLIRNL